MKQDPHSFDSSFSVSWTHKLRFTDCPFENGGVVDSLLSNLKPIQVLVVIDSGLASKNDNFMSQINCWCKQTSTIHTEPIIVAGGETSKNDSSVTNQILDAIHKNNICRKSCILVVGGGAVLDSVGYAASIAHRGIPIIRMPSTTLSQGDSGVGVKNGINLFGKKNFVGVFSPPYAVINDSSLLKTLDNQHWRSGLSEAIKVALIKDKLLYQEINSSAELLVKRDSDAVTSVLKQSAKLHLLHITEGGDPFERDAARPSRRRRRRPWQPKTVSPRRDRPLAPARRVERSLL